MDIPWSITPREQELAGRCLDMAVAAGAQAARITLGKNMMDLFLLRDGILDKVSRSGDRSLTLNLFCDGRYGTFSTNRLEEKGLEDFIQKAAGTVRMLAPDPARKLPDPSRVEKDARTGLETGLYDPAYASMDRQKRMQCLIAGSALYKGTRALNGCETVSEETEYSDSVSDTYVIDTQGTECRHIESSFEIGCETTVRDPQGNKWSGYWWEASPFLDRFSPEGCGEKALARAVRTACPQTHPGGRMAMVVENEVASRLVNPLLSALGAFAIQQNNSFLAGKLGEKVFPDGLTIMDMPRQKGCNGSRLFDSEGVATCERPIIREGIVDMYFVNTYMSGKLGIAPTVEDATRPVVLPFGDAATAAGMMAAFPEGILVTGFNGGNSNAATGDFSYGVEGLYFRGGEPVHPVREMVITGNFLSLWNNLTHAGNDARACMSKQIPSLAFRDVDFSG